MEISSKSPQELVAQTADVYIPVGSNRMMDEDVDTLNQQFVADKDRLLSLVDEGADDSTLAQEMAVMYQDGLRAGIVAPGRGEKAAERIDYAVEKSYEPEADDARETAISHLNKSGLVDNIRMNRRMLETNFQKPIAHYLAAHETMPEEESRIISSLLERTVDVQTITAEERNLLAAQFPGGNFLFHSANTDRLISVVNSGSLHNVKALLGKERGAAIAEGREETTVGRNSGYEGVSWSFNNVEALPGDRFHLAGFLAAPETILGDGEQLAIPSRPAPHELIQIDGNIDVNKLYTLKTQSELLEYFTIGEANSVLGNLLSLKIALDNFKATGQMPEEGFAGTPAMLTFLEEHDDRAIEKLATDQFSLRANGSTELNPDLSQQKDDEIPVAAVWLQSLIAGGRIKQVPAFEDADSVWEIIGRMDGKNIFNLFAELKKDRQYVDQELAVEEAKIGEMNLSVEDMFFVAPHKDLEKWMKVFARAGHLPKGIVTYNDKRVRLENFASKHRGDHEELTSELREAIPKADGYIDWESSLLQEEIGPEKRAGHKHQVIAEKYLANRKSIKKVNGQLVVV